MTGVSVASAATIRYFDIAWLSRFDGPGERSVLFAQGCHLRCPWCHSPHSQPTTSPLLLFPARCTGCGRCAEACPEHLHTVGPTGHLLVRDGCTGCGSCVDACPISQRGRLSGALALPTQEATIDELWRRLAPQLDLVREIGGLTVSGGDPLAQPGPVAELLTRCKEAGIHTALETPGVAAPEQIARLTELVDCWLFGFRPTSVYVPHHAERIEANLAFLTRQGSHVIARMPVVAGITESAASLGRIAGLMLTYGVPDIELLPFHATTSHYYHALGTTCPIGEEAIPTEGRLNEIRAYFEQRGLAARVLR
jgi:pyruvate formate lyase activating enzyme